MTENELAQILKEAHSKAPKGDKSLHMTLFAIQYSKELANHSTARISDLASLGQSGPQLSLGRKLAKYVELLE